MSRILSFILLIFPLIAMGQKAHYSAFSTVDGLPQTQVVDIAQDQNGYLWVGTLGGLSKFNGGKFVNYTTSNGLYNNRVICIRLIDNKIFVGHSGGISVQDKEGFKSVELPVSARQYPVTAIIKYSDRIIVSTNGAGLYEYRNNSLVKMNASRNMEFIRSMELWKGSLVIATYESVWKSNNLVLFELESELPDLDIISILPFNNRLIIGTYMNGLFEYTSNSRLVKKILQTEKLSINQLIHTRAGKVLAATSGGLMEYSGGSMTLKTTSNGLPMNNLSSIFIDNDENVWIGTQGKGLLLAPNLNINYYDVQSGLPSDAMISGFQKENGEFVLGSIDAHIHSTYDFKYFRSKKIDVPTWFMVNNVDGRFWYPSINGIIGVNAEGETVEYTTRNGLAFGRVNSVYRVDANQMYITSQTGVVLYRNGRIISLADTSENIDHLRTVYPHNGNLIVGTERGLFLLKNRKFKAITQIKTAVNSIVSIENGRVFIGSEEGVFEYIDENTVEKIEFSQYTSTNFINFLITKGNDLIAGTNNGLAIIQINGNEKKVVRLTKNNGLIDLETNANSAFFDRMGMLWFGTPSGLVKLDYEKFVSGKQSVKLLFHSLLLNYKSFDYKNYQGYIEDGVVKGLQFPHNKNNLQFEFDQIALKVYDNIGFQYRLEGLESAWSPLTSSLIATYSGLQAGSYVLKARVVNEEGQVLDEIEIPFKIDQAYYKSWWFILLILVAIVTLVLLFFRIRIKREKMTAELEKAEMRTRLVQLEQQSLNASMNRHFIFNSLNSIQYFINISDKLSANKYLSNFAKLIRKNLDTSSEDDNMISLDQEVERLHLYLSLEAMRFNGAFDYQITCNVREMDSIRIPAMMIQPFVENSIIHGVLPLTDRKGMIVVDIREEDDNLVISISDNGIGIDQSFQNKSKSVGDHTSRGMEITMKRIDLIRKISEQHLFIKGPYQLSDEHGIGVGTEVQLRISNFLNPISELE